MRWFYRPVSVMTALLLFGPLAFPLLWKSPGYSLFWKVILTVIFTALGVYFLWLTWVAVAAVIEHFKQIGLM